VHIAGSAQEQSPICPTVATEPSSPPNVFRTSRSLSLSHITPFNNNAILPLTPTVSPKAALRACLEHLFQLLAPHPTYVLCAVTLTIAPELMSSFAELNGVYADFFAGSPPVRTCISVPLPRDQLCEIQAVAMAPDSRTGSSTGWRRALHVQGLSYWAPACIGPYSQAVGLAADGLTFLSGQIAMRPANLDLVVSEEGKGRQVTKEIALSAQHVRRVVSGACEGRGWMEGGVCWVERTAWRSCWPKVAKAWLSWQGGVSEEEEEEEEVTPLVICTAEALPKRAAVEWQLIWRNPPGAEGGSPTGSRRTRKVVRGKVLLGQLGVFLG
jgi:diphthine-ammonia ligase